MIPTIFLLAMAYTPVGEWVLPHLIGIDGILLEESVKVLRFFIIFTIVFPWLDFVNGICMLQKKTVIMTFSQIGNVAMTIIIAAALVLFLPNSGGEAGALSFSLGV